MNADNLFMFTICEWFYHRYHWREDGRIMQPMHGMRCVIMYILVLRPWWCKVDFGLKDFSQFWTLLTCAVVDWRTCGCLGPFIGPDDFEICDNSKWIQMTHIQNKITHVIPICTQKGNSSNIQSKLLMKRHKIRNDDKTQNFSLSQTHCFKERLCIESQHTLNILGHIKYSFIIYDFCELELHNHWFPEMPRRRHVPRPTARTILEYHPESGNHNTADLL